ncbi:DENN domain-containing protein 10-like [Anneissia japonica]|uniref:DENN domain-containing protein 10-like n=1 Tax=Anneissia japonica TaxID=1529436 RepID=UPI001425875F|nr:DENN domain-containing protein 10-like [Anneissia japonica]
MFEKAEKDTNADVLWTWSYPEVTPDWQEVLLYKSPLNSDNPYSQFIYGQHNRQWFYIATQEVDNHPTLTKVKAFSLVLLCKDFNPEKYIALCQILCNAYVKTGRPSSMLGSYLSVLTKGSCASENNGTFLVKDFDVRKAYAESNLRDLIEMFGMETILIYTAMLLKRKVAVYHSNVQDLLAFTRSLPALVWHRQNWSIMSPYVHLKAQELESLNGNSILLMGFTDADVESHTELYDLYVNLPANEITLATHAKQIFGMGKLHKDIAQLMVQCIEEEETTEQQVIKEISVKTKELINNLKSLGEVVDEDDTPSISMDILKGKNLPPATQNFLYNLAAAEGFLQL